MTPTAPQPQGQREVVRGERERDPHHRRETAGYCHSISSISAAQMLPVTFVKSRRIGVRDG